MSVLSRNGVASRDNALQRKIQSPKPTYSFMSSASTVCIYLSAIEPLTSKMRHRWYCTLYVQCMLPLYSSVSAKGLKYGRKFIWKSECVCGRGCKVHGGKALDILLYILFLDGRRRVGFSYRFDVLYYFMQIWEVRKIWVFSIWS